MKAIDLRISALALFELHRAGLQLGGNVNPLSRAIRFAVKVGEFVESEPSSNNVVRLNREHSLIIQNPDTKKSTVLVGTTLDRKSEAEVGLLKAIKARIEKLAHPGFVTVHLNGRDTAQLINVGRKLGARQDIEAIRRAFALPVAASQGYILPSDGIDAARIVLKRPVSQHQRELVFIPEYA